MYKFVLTCLLVTGAHMAQAQTDSAQFFLQKGLTEKNAGRVLESYKYFDRAYKYNKNSPAVATELAAVLYELKRYPQAKEKYVQLEGMGVKEPALYQKLAEITYNMRQFDEAVKYAQLLKKADPSQKIAFRTGKAYYDLENYGEAIRHLNEAIKEEPANAEAPYLIARAYSDMSNFKQAMPYFEKAVALAPTNNRWLYETGLMYYAANDDKNALKYLLLAAEKGYKRDAEYLENLAVAYFGTRQFEEGIAIMKENLQRRPTDIAMLQSIAEASYEIKKYDDAIGYWDRILEQDKQNASALYMIGMSYLKKGDKQKGQSLCNKAIQMDPNLANKRQEVGQKEW